MIHRKISLEQVYDLSDIEDVLPKRNHIGLSRDGSFERMFGMRSTRTSDVYEN